MLKYFISGNNNRYIIIIDAVIIDFAPAPSANPNIIEMSMATMEASPPLYTLLLFALNSNIANNGFTIINIILV